MPETEGIVQHKERSICMVLCYMINDILDINGRSYEGIMELKNSQHLLTQLPSEHQGHCHSGLMVMQA